MSDDQVGGVQSVTRAVRALELIAEEGELGVTDLGRGLGVHKATASRLAATLAAGGLIERDPVTDRYRLGLGLIRLGGQAVASSTSTRSPARTWSRPPTGWGGGHRCTAAPAARSSWRTCRSPSASGSWSGRWRR